MSEFTKEQIAAFGMRAEAMIDELGAISSDPNRLIRLFLTPEHRAAADLVGRWMREAGLTVSEDALGTVRGRWLPQAAMKPKLLLIGSHIDTVIDAGKYDGPLGVIAGVIAAGHVARGNPGLRLGLDVLAFGDEEGSRFRSTLTSSSACAGVFDASALGFPDRDGVTLAEAIKAYGKDPADIPAAAYRAGDVAGYIEVHIEQGPVLEAENRPLGIVTGIVGQTRMRVVVLGEQGHAGTVPMSMRRDALAGAAEIILDIERIASEHAADRMVATVGRIEASPGATNVIPGRVGFSLEVRSMTDDLRRGAIATIRKDAKFVTSGRKIEVTFEPFHETETTACDPAMQDLLESAIGDLDLSTTRMPSGAGHDAQIMAKLCPAAMLFVRCRGGVSHNPAEYASPQDMGLAVAALIRFIERFAAAQP